MPDPVRILVVEDGYIIARDIKRDLENSGYVVVGPVPPLEAAMRSLAGDGERSVDAAVLDINSRYGKQLSYRPPSGEDRNAFPVRDRLQFRRYGDAVGTRPDND